MIRTATWWFGIATIVATWITVALLWSSSVAYREFFVFVGMVAMCAAFVPETIVSRNRWYKRVIVESRADDFCIVAGHDPAHVLDVKEALFREARLDGKLRRRDQALFRRNARKWNVAWPR